MIKRVFAVSALLSLMSCSNSYNLKSGDYYFHKKIYPKAIDYYSRFITNSTNPSEQIPAFIGLAQSWVALGQCDKAAEFYEKAAHEDPWGAISAQAQKETAQCGDFYPLIDQMQWSEGDSSTHGQNMKATIETQAQPNAWLLRRKIFAVRRAPSLFQEQLIIVTKKPGLIWERTVGGPDPDPGTLILQYPLTKGHSWITLRSQKQIRRAIIETNITVKTTAGSFNGCIEVSEEPWANNQQDDIPTAVRIYDTYCPGIGRVRSMIGHLNKRTPHTELLQTPQPIHHPAS